MYKTQNREVHQPQTGWRFGVNMYYVCIENSEVTSILNYRPNVPSSIEVVEISDDNMKLLEAGNHYFNVDTKSVTSKSAEELQEKADAEANIENLEFLRSTDWKVLRHIREQKLGITTSLTEEQYVSLEIQREDAAKAIR